jgi:NADH:ubiquinone oxidoreductase subunit F (NADH-binding)
VKRHSPISVDPQDLSSIVSWPEIQGGVIGEDPWTALDADAHRQRGGYATQRPLPLHHLVDPDRIGGLRGRGGAGFPLLRKIETVRANAQARCARPVIIANGAEGEPISVKDRYLLRFRPHAVIEGLLAAAAAVDAEVAYFYVTDIEARRRVELALLETPGEWRAGREVIVFAAQETFVSGESSAVVRAIMTGVARPVDKPPRPVEKGVNGAPTLVANVETLARYGRLVADPDSPRQSPLLVTVSGDGVDPTLWEVPYGLSVQKLLDAVGTEGSDRSVLVGGFFGGIVPVDDELELSFESLLRAGGGLGCGSLFVVHGATRAVSLSADVAWVAVRAAVRPGQHPSMGGHVDRTRRLFAARRSGVATAQPSPALP